MSVPVERRIRALVLLAAIALVAGLARVVARAWPAAPGVAWIDAPGIPVELAGDGVYFLPAPATLGALLARAGHDCTAVGGDRPLAPGDRVAVAAPRCTVTVDRMSGAARLTLRVPLDANRDDADALAALPHVGPALARAIVRDRARRGPFRSVDDLERVRGVGPATLRAIRRHLVASHPEDFTGRHEGWK